VTGVLPAGRSPMTGREWTVAEALLQGPDGDHGGPLTPRYGEHSSEPKLGRHPHARGVKVTADEGVLSGGRGI
jgi:hypothetical protein